MTFEEYEELNFRKIRKKIDKSDISNVDLTKDEIFDIFKDFYHMTHPNRNERAKYISKESLELGHQKMYKKVCVIIGFVPLYSNIKVHMDYRSLKHNYNGGEFHEI